MGMTFYLKESYCSQKPDGSTECTCLDYKNVSFCSFTASPDFAICACTHIPLTSPWSTSTLEMHIGFSSSSSPVFLPGWGCGALSETILEAAGHCLQVLHAARARAAAAVGLLAPIVRPHLLCRVTTAGAPLLLIVECPLPAARAQTVALRVLLSHRRCAITHGCNCRLALVRPTYVCNLSKP